MKVRGLLLTAISVLLSSAPAVAGQTVRDVCGPVPAGYATCDSEVQVNPDGQPHSSTQPDGYGPAQLQSAYTLKRASAVSGRRQTVAIVVAYDDPNAAADLANYRATFGLPPCPTWNGCLTKVDQNGGTNYPPANTLWGEEISLDLDAASAICPNCKLLLVEAGSNAFADLMSAEDYATAHATVVSNSWGSIEFKGESHYDRHFRKIQIPVTFSSGDAGYGSEQYPAASRFTTGVGGTDLTPADTPRGWNETVWPGTSSGCSVYEKKPAWQTDTGCAGRTSVDVAAVAAANAQPAAAVYDSYNEGGWLKLGGTSLASPVIAGVYALAGDQPPDGFEYEHPSGLFDVVAGSNGTCSPVYLCTAGPGYDGPSGLGTPNGTSSF